MDSDHYTGGGSFDSEVVKRYHISLQLSAVLLLLGLERMLAKFIDFNCDSSHCVYV